jgi:hypothetical protein
METSVNNSKYTFAALSGSFDLTIELDDDAPEPVPDTISRALEDLTTKGVVPADALITNWSVSSTAAGFARCSVHWTLTWPSPALLGRPT